MRIKLIIAYDGQGHDGWQSQPSGNTIQDLIEKAAADTAKEPIRIHGSGRTDAGVHAFGQVAHFDAPDHLTMNPFNWVPALNTKLPPSIRVLTAEEVDSDFHARFSAVSKTYHYDICTEPVLSPFKVGRVWHLPRQLDPYLLEQAMELTLGRHNFEAFSAKRGNETEATDYHRTITQADLQPLDHGWRLTWTADGFLYKMVRLLTGTVVGIGQGRVPLEALTAALQDSKDSQITDIRSCAPSDGLHLKHVRHLALPVKLG